MNPLTANTRRPSRGFPRENLTPGSSTTSPVVGPGTAVTAVPTAIEPMQVVAYLATLTVGARVRWFHALILWLAARIVRRIEGQATAADHTQQPAEQVTRTSLPRRREAWIPSVTSAGAGWGGPPAPGG